MMMISVWSFRDMVLGGARLAKICGVDKNQQRVAGISGTGWVLYIL
jgi:hypothetical protein